jgi:hypothetical protein
VTREELHWKDVMKKAQIQFIDNVRKGIGTKGSYYYQKFKEDWTHIIPQIEKPLGLLQASRVICASPNNPRV